MKEEMNGIENNEISHDNIDEATEEVTEEKTKGKAKGKGKGKGSSKKDTTKQFKLTISDKDERVQEVLSRVKGPGLRDDFIKEAIYYWDYILHRAPAFTSRYTDLRSDFILNDDERILHIPSSPPFEPKQDVERKAINLKLTVSLDDKEMLEILDRAYMIQEYAREAIYYWDYILHHSSFHSRYINLKPGTEKKYNGYGTILNSQGTQQYNIGDQVGSQTYDTTANITNNDNLLSSIPSDNNQSPVTDEETDNKPSEGTDRGYLDTVTQTQSETKEPSEDTEETPVLFKRRGRSKIEVPID